MLSITAHFRRSLPSLPAPCICWHATMLSLSREMKKEEARALALGPSAKVMADMMVLLDKLVSINTDGGVRSSASADATYAASRASLIGLLVGIVVIGMLLALWVTRSVARPLIAAVGVARQVAAGDLTAHIVVQSQDETGQLMQALKDMNASLQNLVGQVRSGTDTIAKASSQIAAGNQARPSNRMRTMRARPTPWR